MSVSEHLIYQIIQNNSCFNKTSRLWGGTRFSKEKSNVLNLNKFKYSGLARKNSLGVFLTNKGEIAVRKADSKNEQNPRKRTRVTKIKKLGYNKRATFVVQQTAGSAYRPELLLPAVKRVARLQHVYNARRKAKKVPTLVKTEKPAEQKKDEVIKSEQKQ